MSWEKGNHPKGELLQGKSDQGPSSDPLLPVVSAAPHCCSSHRVDVQRLSSREVRAVPQGEPKGTCRGI